MFKPPLSRLKQKDTIAAIAGVNVAQVYFPKPTPTEALELKNEIAAFYLQWVRMKNPTLRGGGAKAKQQKQKARQPEKEVSRIDIFFAMKIIKKANLSPPLHLEMIAFKIFIYIDHHKVNITE